MGIGIPAGRPGLRPTLAQKQAEPGVVVLDWITATGYAPLFQGADMAVAPLADSATGLIAPPVPGGLQMQKVVALVQGQPIGTSLPKLVDAWSRLHVFVNFQMTKEGYFTPWPIQ